MSKIKLELKASTLGVICFLLGCLVTSVVWLLVDKSVGVNDIVDYRDNASGTNPSSPASATTAPAKQYQTDLRDFFLTLESGEEIEMHAPEGLTNLSDQYQEAMISYYGEVAGLDDFITIGNSDVLSYTTVMVSAAPLSATRKVLEALNPDMTEEELEEALYSEAYLLMTTGELPELDETHEMSVEELKTDILGGILWHYYKISYVQEYYTDDTMTETIKVPIEELAVYSSTADSVEIIAYSNDESTSMDDLVAYVDELLQW